MIVMFMETLAIPKDVWNPITGLVHHGLYKNERSAIIEIVGKVQQLPTISDTVTFLIPV